MGPARVGGSGWLSLQGPRGRVETAAGWAEGRRAEAPGQVRGGETVRTPGAAAAGGRQKGDRKGARRTRQPTGKKAKLEKQKEIPYKRFPL